MPSKFLLFFAAFILHRGRVALQLSSIEVQCRMVIFKPADFTSDSAVHVQVSVNYYNATGNFVHDAAVAWAESITYLNFSACALKAGRNDRLTPDKGLTYVDYIAYQAAPKGAVAGEESLSKWWDGTTCTQVGLPQVERSAFCLLIFIYLLSCPSKLLLLLMMLLLMMMMMLSADVLFGHFDCISFNILFCILFIDAKQTA